MTKLTHYRHATSIIEIDGKKILIDPVFEESQAYPPIIYTKNPKKNPLIDLPVEYNELLKVDGVIITHDHNDHFDELAKKVIPKDMPILCQDEDRNKFQELGFTNLTPIVKSAIWLDLNCERFIGYHGGHLLRKKLGVSSSYSIESRNATTYITGDTLLTGKVKKILNNINPQYIIANGGGAKMKFAGQLTMKNKDIVKLSKLCPSSKIIAVHMDSINHCFDTRDKLVTQTKGISNVIIPKDGETIVF